MLKLEIKKHSFFYCGDIALSKKSKPTIELDIDKLEDKVVKGLLRAIATSAIDCTVGYEDLLKRADKVLKDEEEKVAEETVTKEKEETPKSEEAVSTQPEPPAEVSQVEDKPTPAKRTRTSK